MAMRVRQSVSEEKKTSAAREKQKEKDDACFFVSAWWWGRVLCLEPLPWTILLGPSSWRRASQSARVVVVVVSSCSQGGPKNHAVAAALPVVPPSSSAAAASSARMKNKIRQHPTRGASKHGSAPTHKRLSRVRGVSACVRSGEVALKSGRRSENTSEAHRCLGKGLLARSGGAAGAQTTEKTPRTFGSCAAVAGEEPLEEENA
jgi:hypothetical protein